VQPADPDDAPEAVDERTRSVELARTGEHREVGVVVEGALDRGEPGRRAHRVGVDACEKVAARRVEPGRGGAWDAGDRLDHDPRTGGAGDGSRVVGAAVVDDDDLIRLPGLRGERLEAAC